MGLLFRLLLKELLDLDLFDLFVLDWILDVLVRQVDEHIAYLLHQEGDTPLEEVHLLRQMERVSDIFILFNIHFVVFNQDDGSLVVVFPAIIRRAEYSDYRRESLMAAPTMHFVAIDLNLMSTNDRDEVVLAQNLFDGIKSEFN